MKNIFLPLLLLSSLVCGESTIVHPSMPLPNQSWAPTDFTESINEVKTMALTSKQGGEIPPPVHSTSTLMSSSNTPPPIADATPRQNISYSERFETPEWWKKDWLGSASITDPKPATQNTVRNIEHVTTGCVSGNCIKMNVAKYSENGGSMFYPIPGNNESVTAEYYIKWADNFTPNIYDTSTHILKGSGGKIPGLADIRQYPDPQCGNGGNQPNGLDCWSMRLMHLSCDSKACAGHDKHRIGGYVYYPNNVTSNGDLAVFDGEGGGQIQGGIGDAGLTRGEWHKIKIQVSMNTPGQLNGVIRAWIDDELKFEKTNMLWRDEGHDNLHVRLFWLNVFFGGWNVGPLEDTYIMLDELTIKKAEPVISQPSTSKIEKIPGSVIDVLVKVGDFDFCWQIKCYKAQNAFIAWNVGAYDGESIWWPAGGGHADYGGNEIYRYNIAKNKWTRETDPSPLTGPFMRDADDAGVTDGVLSHCPTPEVGMWSSHFYTNAVHNPITGEILVTPGSGWCAKGAPPNMPQTWGYMPSTKQWRLAADTARLTAAQYDPERNVIYALGGGKWGHILEVDPITLTTTKISDSMMYFSTAGLLYDHKTKTMWINSNAAGLGKSILVNGKFEYQGLQSDQFGRKTTYTKMVMDKHGRVIAWDGLSKFQIYDTKSGEFEERELAGYSGGTARMPTLVYLEDSDTIILISDPRQGVYKVKLE